ncbi:MAG: NAD(P)H-dependent oxidoreductase [Methanomicrobiaceae archaeon]|nr:NAD(P)H-dependent oxidoreductase [Methanomicrobiaceae archaeon]
MKVAVLNGSPKGNLSITKRYVDYLNLKFPSNDYIFLNISEDIRKIEREEEYFNDILDEIENADAVLWAFPVYYCLVPSQYKKFIEIVFERGRKQPFFGKYTTAISTSIHFFDHTAHNYIHAISDDLNMKYTGFFSAKMDDLLNEEGRRNLISFWEIFEDSIAQKKEIRKYYLPVDYENAEYNPTFSKKQVDITGKKVVILTDADTPDSNAMKMSEKLKSSLNGTIEIINLHNIGMKGGCKGCIRCGFNNQCIYNDGFSDWYERVLKSADIVILSCTIKDRYISSIWKQFLDRSFFSGHVPSLAKKTLGIMISGPYSQIENLKEIFEGYLEMSSGYPGGIISDESEKSDTTDRIIEGFAEKLAFVSEKTYMPPMTFRGTGGRKIFRDDIWDNLRPIFRADDRYYKKNGLYDFPQKNYSRRIKNKAMIILFSVPQVKKSVVPRFKQEMVKPFDIMLEKIREKL